MKNNDEDGESDNTDIRLLQRGEVYELLELLKKCFSNDNFFQNIKKNNLWDTFIPFLEYSIDTESAYGCFIDDQLAGALVSANYHNLKKNTELFEIAFIKEGNSIPYGKEIEDMVKSLSSDVQYIVDICVDDNYRRQGIAGKLIDKMMINYDNSSFAVDISNPKSLPMYIKRGFLITELNPDYYLAKKA